MALQSPFFGKRDADSTGTRPAPLTQPVRPGGPSASAAPGSNSASGVGQITPAEPAEAPAQRAGQSPHPTADSLLKVGPNIRLKGVEITDCDTLFVEGTVEATMDSRVMEIAPPGHFKGTAEIDMADIHGHFEGTLTVRERLVIHPTGRVSGTVRYGKLSIAEGGQISGDVGLLQAATPLASTPPITSA